MFPKLNYVKLAFGETLEDDAFVYYDDSFYDPAHDFMRTFETINEFIEQKKTLLATQPTGSTEVMVIWLIQSGLIDEQTLKNYLEDFSPHKNLDLLSLSELEWKQNAHNLNPFAVDAAASPRFAWALKISTVGVTVYVVTCDYGHLECGPRDSTF